MIGELAPLVDVHAHFVTDFYLTAAKAAGHLLPDGMSGWPSWDAATHLELMDQWGVGTAMLSVSSPGTHFGDDGAARFRACRMSAASTRSLRGTAAPGYHATSRVVRPYTTWKERKCASGETARSSGKRWSRAGKAIRISMRASGAPRQWCTPWPKAT